MPIVSVFHGIVIRMFVNEHMPPHFHAFHQGDEAIFTFDGSVWRGDLRSAWARAAIAEWANLHRSELERNWNLARAGQALETISPLP